VDAKVNPTERIGMRVRRSAERFMHIAFARSVPHPQDPPGR
jgi:hypothetical protein